MKKNILEYVQEQVEDNLRKIKEGEGKMAQNYNHNFEWGYPEQIYRHKYIGYNLQHLETFVSNEPARAGEWLKHNIEQIERRLLDGKYQENSTSEFSRIAYRIKLEADAHLRQLYVRWLHWITEKDTPIV
jgi:hypothetical protein